MVQTEECRAFDYGTAELNFKHYNQVNCMSVWSVFIYVCISTALCCKQSSHYKGHEINANVARALVGIKFAKRCVAPNVGRHFLCGEKWSPQTKTA